MTVKTMRMLIVLWVVAVIALTAAALLLAGCQPWPGPVMKAKLYGNCAIAEGVDYWPRQCVRVE